MVTPGEETGTTAVVLPSQTVTLLSQGSGPSNGRTCGRQILSQRAAHRVKSRKSERRVCSHDLHPCRRLSCDGPVRFTLYSEAAASLICLHSDNTVCLYKADGQKQTSPVKLTFLGLTATKMPGCLIGWGPGPVLTLLDSEFRPLEAARDALDIRVCQAAEHSIELVTAGVGNVCVWSALLMRCKLRIQEGLQDSTFTLMAVAHPRPGRPHRAFVACREVVTVVDLDAGKVLEHKNDLCSGAITAMVYCTQQDCLIIASKELSITVWGPDWEKRMTFVGHNDVVNSLFYCPALNILLSSSMDCTIRCWATDEGHVFECGHTELKNTPLYVGGTGKGDMYFSCSNQGVDFWTIKILYTLHCKLKGDEGVPLRQILVSQFPAPYPTRVLCVGGDSDITLVAAGTGQVLTSFKAKRRILCADYCLQKEVLLALTEKGTVLQASTLTNPVTLMQVWKKRGWGPWHHRDPALENETQDRPVPGPACCLVLYSSVVETQAALEEWRNLQERRGCRRRNVEILDDDKNKYLIILGQSGGCLSVLKMDDGRVLCRTPAHSRQRVTAMQAYPDSGCLLSSGEDMTVTVWRVFPHIHDCLSQLLSLHCGQPQVCSAMLGSQLALTFRHPNSGTHSLLHFDLLSQSQTDDPPMEGHLNRFTGLCVCPDLEVFVSSNSDGAVRIWNERNRLIGTFQLNAVPECLAYGGFGDKLFLAIKGDLYRINCAEFLPDIYQKMLLYTYCAERVPDSPISEDEERSSKTEDARAETDGREELPAVQNVFLTEDPWMQKEYERVVASNMNLAALLQGSVKCKREKPQSTNETKKEAFDRYMKILYRLPDIKVKLEDFFEQDTLKLYSKLYTVKPYKRPTVKEDVNPELNDPVNVEKQKAPAAKSVLKTQMKVTPRTVPVPKTPVIVQREEKLPEIIPPAEEPKPKTPAPSTLRPKTRVPTPPPPREPTPEVPGFLKQFADKDWFKDLYPDKKCLPSIVSPEDFSLQLLSSLRRCSAPTKMKILGALQALRSQGLLHNTDQLYQGLMDLLPKFVRPHMSPLERRVLVEMLTLLLRLKPAGYDLVKKLLTLLAFKNLGLKETVLHILTVLGVNEAEEWIWPELQSWDSELRDKSNIWKDHHDRADCWLESWISKYKEHDRYLYLTSAAKWKPPTFSAADVLNYFCSVQKEEYEKAHCAPAGCKNTVLLPLYDCSSQPIFRLGETYSMARIRRPSSGFILPPLRSRSFLTQFPNFISLPVSRMTLCPFHVYSDEDWVKASPRCYFVPDQSYVDYYR